jgi:hypothetical protein
VSDDVEKITKDLGPEDIWKSYVYRQKALVALGISSDEYFLINHLSSYNPSYPSVRTIRNNTRWGHDKILKVIKQLFDKKFLKIKSGRDTELNIRADCHVYEIDFNEIKRVFDTNIETVPKIGTVKKKVFNCSRNRNRSVPRARQQTVPVSGTKSIKEKVLNKTATTESKKSSQSSSSFSFDQKEAEQSDPWNKIEIPGPLRVYNFNLDVINQIKTANKVSPEILQRSLDNFSEASKDINYFKTINRPRAYFIKILKEGNAYELPEDLKRNKDEIKELIKEQENLLPLKFSTPEHMKMKRIF